MYSYAAAYRAHSLLDQILYGIVYNHTILIIKAIFAYVHLSFQYGHEMHRHFLLGALHVYLRI